MNKFLKSLFVSCFAITIASAGGVGTEAYDTPADVDVKNGMKMYEAQCAMCHGPKGMATQSSDAPPLNGQYARYMVTQLEAFADDRHKYKRDSANSEQMIPFAKMLSKKEMWDVSVYLENVKERRKFPKEWWDKNQKDIDWSNKYRQAGCTACHGDKHDGRYPSAPKLAGLPAKYLKQQMDAYSKGTRRGAQSMQMKLMADFYSPEDEAKMYLMIEADEEHK